MAKPKAKPLITKQRDSKSTCFKVAGGVSKKKEKKKKANSSHSKASLPVSGSHVIPKTGKNSLTKNGQSSSLINGNSLKKSVPMTAGKKVDESASKTKAEAAQGHGQKKLPFKHNKGFEFKNDNDNLNVKKVPQTGNIGNNSTTYADTDVKVGVKTTSQLSRGGPPVKPDSSNLQKTTPITSLETSGGKHHKKSKASKKKKQSGSSNWMKLCSTLNISTERKPKPVKRQIEQTAQKAEDAEPKRPKPEIWFDNVDKILLETSGSEKETELTDKDAGNVSNSNQDSSNALVKPDSYKGVTNCVAMDCEMVGIGSTAEESMLARVSIVNHFGVCLYDKFVKPQEKVTDYRTFVSGVTEENLAQGEDFSKVQKEVSDILKGRILVGHAVHNDLKVLFLTHPHKMIRDTSVYQPFRALFNGRKPALKKLTDKVLGVKVQEGQHSSVQDAQATMRLYTMYRQRWEKEIKGKRKKNEKDTKKKE